MSAVKEVIQREINSLESMIKSAQERHYLFISKANYEFDDIRVMQKKLFELITCLNSRSDDNA